MYQQQEVNGEKKFPTGCKRLHELPNFRPAFTHGNQQQQQQLYRSSYIERLSELGMSELAATVKTVIDLRGSRGLEDAESRNLVAKYFQQRQLMPSGEWVSADASPAGDTGTHCTHYSLDFVGRQFIKALVLRLSPWQMLQFGYHALLEKIFKQETQRAALVELIGSQHSHLSDIYIEMLDNCQSEMAAALRLLADPSNLPCLLHCQLGKDRTGIVVMLLQWLLGYDRDAIAEEYHLSKELTAEITDEVLRYYSASGSPQNFTGCEKSDILLAMDHIFSKHGSVQQYLATIGLTEQEMAALRNNFSGQGV